MTVTPTHHRDPAADPDPLVAPTRAAEPPAGTAPPPAAPDALPGDKALAFADTGGPLLAVCGLQGGAGASTLANVIAASAAAASEQPVMLCEAPGAGGDQAALTGARSQLTLEDLAATVATSRRPPRRFWAQTGRLRLLATAPRPTPPHATGRAVANVLATARAEHALTVVDAGDVRDPRARTILEAATHVLWVLRLEPGAVERARERLASRLVPALAARQALAVRGARPRERFAGEGRALRELAAQHAERLLLVPELPHRDGRPDPDSARARRLAAGLVRFLEQPWPG